MNRVKLFSAVTCALVAVSSGVRLRGATGGVGPVANSEQAQPSTHSRQEESRRTTAEGQLHRAIEDTARAKRAADIEAIEADITALRGRSQRLSQRLQAIVLDDARAGEDRWVAAMALGKLGDKDGIEFLVKHVALVVPPGGRIASDRTWPCFNALDAAGWSCVPAVLRHLEHERSELELALSTTFLRKTLGREAATTFVAEQARTSDDDSYRRNLRRVLEMIPTS